MGGVGETQTESRFVPSVFMYITVTFGIFKRYHGDRYLVTKGDRYLVTVDRRLAQVEHPLRALSGPLTMCNKM